MRQRHGNETFFTFDSLTATQKEEKSQTLWLLTREGAENRNETKTATYQQ